MRRKESSREKMGCFRGRIPNRLSCNGAPVITNCSIMRMPGKMAVMMVIMITTRGRGRAKEEADRASCALWPSLSGSSLPLSDQGLLGLLGRKDSLSRATQRVV